MANSAEIFDLAMRIHQSGDLAQAESLYRQILQAEPTHAVALHMLGILAQQNYNLGNTFKEQGQPVEAARCYRQAVALKPDIAGAYNNLGNALKDQGLLEEAILAYQQALVLNPNDVEALNNLGIALKEQGGLDEAAACIRQALQVNPNLSTAHYNLGNILQEQRKYAEAAECYRQALRLNPNHVEAHNNLGLAFEKQEMLAEAAQCYRQAVRLEPNYGKAQSNLGNVLFAQGQQAQAIACQRRALLIQSDFAAAYANLLFALMFSPDDTAQSIFEQHRLWNRQFAQPLAKLVKPHGNERSPDRRLRIGYVSPNFRMQAEIFFLAPLFDGHDRENFEIFCYADVPCPDNCTARIRSRADIWRSIVGLTDEQVAELIRQDRIDILVDLTMHMADNRLLVFARKPAPVQVCWLAYQGTTGLDTMDYRLTDVHVDPPGLFDPFYAEKSIRLPDAFGCYDPLDEEPFVQAPPVLKNSHITFGSLNNFWKINEPILRLWAAVLRAVEHSRMIILAHEGLQRQQILDVFEREGVSPDRVAFVGKCPRPRYLARYHEIDIGLDTLPYNGQTTTLDSLWMGVPVLTLAGQTAVGRAGLSLLTNLGLTEWIAHTPQQYVDKAIQLSGDLQYLAQLRGGLRERLRQSPLMDGPRFAQNVEAAYRKMWHAWCKDKIHH